MKRRLSLVVVSVLAVFVGGVVFQARTLDGFGGLFCIRENTQYATDYSDAAFRRIRVGMAESEAIAILGQPRSSSDSTAATDSPDRAL